MKRHISTGIGITVMVSALLAANTTRADISSVTNNSTVSTWDSVGGTPFYATSLSGLSSQGFPSKTTDPYIVLSETFTITNGAGGLTSTTGPSNYMLNAISLIGTGGNGPVQIHLFDVTTNLTSNNGTTLNGSGATYNFVANGDLFGNGSGLTFSNNLAAESQEVIVLQNGPSSVDQVVLGANHTYALEFWVPATETGNLFWYRGSTADPGGQAMGSHAGSLATARLTITSLGLAGGAPRTFAVALYGAPTTSPPSANSNISMNTGTTNYTVDDFSTNGVGPENVTIDDYFASTNVYIGTDNITNVWWNWFGGALTNVYWSPNDARGNPASGSMAVQLSFGGNNQFVLHHENYANIPNISSLTYTSLEVDVRWDPSSVLTTTNTFGPLRFGVRPNAVYSVQDWFYTTNIPAADTNWIHLSIPLSRQDPNLSTSFGELLIGMDTTGQGLSGGSTLYIDNIAFKGSAIPFVPPPVLSIQPAKPGLRIYAGSTAQTYDREDLVSVGQNQSWIGGTYPVTYAFSLLSYPNNNINQTMVEIVPVNTLPSGDNTYGQEYGDYQDANGMWLVLAPNGAGAVTASVEWKTNAPNTNPNQMAMTFTNPTAIGTWTWTFTGPNNGTVTAPGGLTESFTVTDATVTADFANPAISQFGLQPNSSAGEGLYETWGSILVSNVVDGISYEDFTHESSDISPNAVTGYNTTPGGSFETANSANQNSSIIIRPGLDQDWVTWTTPAVGFNLVESTNVSLAPATHWVTPSYYSGGNDVTAPRGTPELEGPIEVEVIPNDNAPTANGQAGGPLSPYAYFLLTTNTPSATP